MTLRGKIDSCISWVGAASDPVLASTASTATV